MSVGSVFYDVLPNLDGFAAKVAAGLGTVPPVKVKVDVDNTSAAKTTAVAQRAAAQQTAIAQRAAAQQAAIRARGAQQQALLAQRTAAQQAAFAQRQAASAERLAAREAAAQVRAAEAVARAQQKAAAASQAATGRKANVADNLGKLDAAAASTERLSAADARLASAQGTARVAALRLAEAQAAGAEGTAGLLASQESYARSLRAVSVAETAAAAASNKTKVAGSFTGKVNTGEVQAVGRSFAVAGAAIGVGVGLAVRASANFEQAMSSVASTGNYTTGQLDLLSKAAVAGGQATQYSATEAAQGEAELVKAGLSVQQVLGGGLTGALNLAAAGNLSVADSASAAATAINQFNLQGSDATHVADRFVQIAGVAQGETSDVAEAFKNGAVTAHQYGLSIDDTSDVLGAFAKNGLVGAQAGTLLKSSLTNLYAPTGRVKEELTKLSVSAYDAAGNAKSVSDVAEDLHSKLAPLSEDARNNALARIFGKETLQGGAILAQQGAAGLGAIRKELDQFPSAAQTAATKMDNLKGDVEQLSGSLETGLIKSGSGANGFFRDLVQGATSAVNAFTDLPAVVQKGALGLAAGASAALLLGAGLVKVVNIATGVKGALAILGLGSEAAAAEVAVLGTASATATGEVTALGAASTATGGKAAALKTGIGVAAIALAALSGEGFAVQKFFGTVPTTLGDAGQAIAGVQKNADGATPSLDKFFSFANNQGVDSTGTSSINGLAQAFGQLEAHKGAGGVLESIVGAIPGVVTGTEQVNDRFSQLDQVLSRTAATSAPDAANSFAAIAKTAADQQVPLDKLVALFPQYKQQLQDQATALGVTVPDSAQVYADWMGGKVPDAVLAAAKANPQAAASFGVVGDAADATSKGLDTAKTALESLINPQKISGDAAQALSTKLFGNAQAALSASSAQIAYAQAVKQAKASTGGGIDPKTDKGASNLSLLNAQASAYQQVAASQIAAGRSAGDVASGTKQARSAFIDNAEAMGVSSGKAADLADKYGLIPKRVETKIKETVEKSAGDELTKLKALDGTVITPKIQALIDQGKYKQALAGVKELQKDRRAKIKAEADPAAAKRRLDDAAKARTAALKAQAQGVDRANRLINNAARGRSATISVKAILTGADAAIAAAKKAFSATGGTITPHGVTGRGPGPVRRSEGGSVWGAGTATSDSIPAMLSNGEEVTRTVQAKKNRAILKTINAGGVWDLVPRRAKGGTIERVPSKTAAARPTSAGPQRIVINVDLGPELGGIRRIVADEIAASGEYAATVSRMRGGR